MKKYLLPLVTLLIAIFITPACGPSSSSESHESGVTLTLNLPDELTDERGRAVPSYITGIFLTVTGDRMETINLEFTIPDDGSAPTLFLAVTPGVRLFSVIITTSLGKTFTGSREVDVVAGESGTIEISLTVNVAPTVTLTASKREVLAGEVVKLAATATDLDEDSLTYSWRKSGGQLSAKDLAGSWKSDTPGSYSVTFTASDGRGGSGSASVKITVLPVDIIMSHTWSGGVGRGCTLINSYKVEALGPVTGNISCTSSANFWLDVFVVDFDVINKLTGGPGPWGNMIGSNTAVSPGAPLSLNVTFPAAGFYYIQIGDSWSNGSFTGESFSCKLTPGADFTPINPFPLWLEYVNCAA